MKKLLLSVLVLLTTGCTTTPQQTLFQTIPGWNTYSYKNVSFQYPPDWEVVFDGEVANQPNGFGLHVQSKDSEGFEPDGFSLGTYNDREDNPTNYHANINKLFTNTPNGDDYIYFSINGITLYAGCGYYSNQQATLDICNKITSTIALE